MRITPSPCCSRSKRHDTGSTVINALTGLWNCWACGSKGNWFGITQALGDPIPVSDRYTQPVEIDFSIADQIRSRMRRPVTQGHYPELLAYCHSRGLTSETLNAWRVSTSGPDCLRFPIYALRDGKWEMVNARIRKVLNRESPGPKDWFEVKGGPTELCLGNHLLGEIKFSIVNHNNGLKDQLGGTEVLPKRVFVVEGQWDAMTAWQLGIPNVLSLPNGANHVAVGSMFRYIPDDYEVWLAVDMDDPGERCVESFFAQLGSDKVARAMMPFKDINEWMMKCPDLNRDHVYNSVKGMTEQVTKKDFLIAETNRLSSFLNVLDIATEEEEGSKFIASWPWPRLNKRLGGGIRTQETTGLLAPSGIGKTTIVNQIAIQVAKEGITVGIISLEGSRRDLGTKIIKQAKHWTGYVDNQFSDLCSRIKISRLEGSSVTWQECLKEAEVLCTAGAKLIVMDNLDYCMPRGVGAFQASAIKLEAYAQFQDLARSTDIHVVMVWQPNKVDRDQVINSGNQKGMSQALQDADNYLSLNRIGNLRRLEIEKSRFEGIIEQNKFVFLNYDKEKGCLFETDHHAELSLLGNSLPQIF